MTSRTDRPRHRLPKERRSVMPRWRIALAAGVALTAAGTGVGIACTMPSGGETQQVDAKAPRTAPEAPDVLPSEDRTAAERGQRTERGERGERTERGQRPERPQRQDIRERRRASDTRPAPSRPAPTSPTATQPRPQAPGSDGGADSAETSATEQVVRLVNEERAAAGCPALKTDSRLTRAAQEYSDVLAASRRLSHTGPDGSTIGSRADAVDYPWSGLGENIAQGQRTPAEVMDAWMDSPGHRANILNCGFTDIGVGVNHGAGGPWWTQDFGSSR